MAEGGGIAAASVDESGPGDGLSPAGAIPPHGRHAGCQRGLEWPGRKKVAPDYTRMDGAAFVTTFS